MKSSLFAADRCSLFKNLASDVWDRLTNAHDVDINLSEIGITADILVDILLYSKNHTANFDVYAKAGWNEKVFGCDIEIFIETQRNEFCMFALQAKVLKKNNRYTTLRDSSDGRMQWDKLNLLEKATGCKSYFLLYNGKDRWSHNGNDKCSNPHNEKQFGCSLIEPNDIMILATKTNSNGRIDNPTFNDIHPQYAQPWRILTCCYHTTANFTLYSLEQILSSNPALLRINYDPIDTSSEVNAKDESKYGNDDAIPLVVNNKINQGSREAKWNPSVRIIIKRTPDLQK